MYIFCFGNLKYICWSFWVAASYYLQWCVIIHRLWQIIAVSIFRLRYLLLWPNVPKLSQAMSKKILQADNAVDLVHSLVPKKDHLCQDRAFCWVFPLCPLGFLCSRQTGWVGEVEHTVAGLEQTVYFPLFVIMHALLCCSFFFPFSFLFYLFFLFNPGFSIATSLRIGVVHYPFAQNRYLVPV